MEGKKTKAGWNRLVLLLVLFVFALLTLVGTILLVFTYSGRTDDKAVSNYSEYLKTNSFRDEIGLWSEIMVNSMLESGAVKDKVTEISPDDIMYRISEFSDFDWSGKKEVTQEDLPYQDVTYKTLKKKHPTTASDIKNGIDNGDVYYYFYSDLKQQLGTKDVKDYLYLTGEQFYQILECYATVKSGEEDSRYYDKEFDAALTRASNGDEEGAVSYYQNTKDSVYGYHNKTNNNLVFYSMDGGFYELYTNGVWYSFDYQDASDGKEFYIPASQLCYDSEEKFYQSIITAPFTTVEEPLAYLGMQKKIKSIAEFQDRYFAIDLNLINEVDYRITLSDYVMRNCTDQQLAKDDVISYNATGKTFDAKTKRRIDSGALALSENDFASFSDYENIQKVEIGLKNNVSLTSLNSSYFRARLLNYIDILIPGLILSLLFFVITFAVVIYREVAEVKRRDRHYLFTKLLVGGAILLGITLLVELLYEGVTMDGFYGNEVPILVMIALLLVILSAIVYIVLMYLLLSSVRLIKSHQFKDYLLLVYLYRHGVKANVIRITEAAKVVWNNQGTLKKNIMRELTHNVIHVLFLLLFLLFLFSQLNLGAVMCLAAWLLYFGRCFYLLYQDQKMLEEIVQGIMELANGNVRYQIDTSAMKGEKKQLASQINRISEGLEKAIDKSIRDERLKAELITNVSHDIKTPLTSIINYVDLIKREHIDTEPLKRYVEVLDQKSKRLKQLTEDLVEASKASTGNIELTPINLNMEELINQTIGEFEDRFMQKNLQVVTEFEEADYVIFADGRRCFRVFENLFQNIFKYSMPNTRVYVTLNRQDGCYVLCLRNISENPLKKDVSELTNRFVRGDEARSSEGSGLGLSIAKSLTELMGGTFEIALDGDLFKVSVSFAAAE